MSNSVSTAPRVLRLALTVDGRTVALVQAAEVAPSGRASAALHESTRFVVFVLEAGGGVVLVEGLGAARTCLLSSVPSRLQPALRLVQTTRSALLLLSRDLHFADTHEASAPTSLLLDVAAAAERQAELHWSDDSKASAAAWLRCALLHSDPLVPGLELPEAAAAAAPPPHLFTKDLKHALAFMREGMTPVTYHAARAPLSVAAYWTPTWLMVLTHGAATGSGVGLGTAAATSQAHAPAAPPLRCHGLAWAVHGMAPTACAPYAVTTAITGGNAAAHTTAMLEVFRIGSERGFARFEHAGAFTGSEVSLASAADGVGWHATIRGLLLLAGHADPLPPPPPPAGNTVGEATMKEEHRVVEAGAAVDAGLVVGRSTPSLQHVGQTSLHTCGRDVPGTAGCPGHVYPATLTPQHIAGGAVRAAALCGDHLGASVLPPALCAALDAGSASGAEGNDASSRAALRSQHSSRFGCVELSDGRGLAGPGSGTCTPQSESVLDGEPEDRNARYSAGGSSSDDGGVFAQPGFFTARCFGTDAGGARAPGGDGGSGDGADDAANRSAEALRLQMAVLRAMRRNNELLRQLPDHAVA
jgi:hypothetical protein